MKTNRCRGRENGTVPENVTVRPTCWDRILEGVGVVLAMALIGLSAVIYTHSPGQVPVHFNYRGEADDWGEPEMVLVFAGLGVVLMLVSAAAAYHRQLVNLPIRLNPNCLPVQLSVLGRMCRLMTLCIGGLMLGILSMMAPVSWHIAAAGDVLRMLCMLSLLLVLAVFSGWIWYIGRRCR